MKLLKKGLNRNPTPAAKMMTKSDGTKCSNANENAEVFREHFQKLYGRTPAFDPTVLDLLDSHPIHEGLDHPPTDLEIINATRNLKNNSPGESGIMPLMFKCLISSVETLGTTEV